MPKLLFGDRAKYWNSSSDGTSLDDSSSITSFSNNDLVADTSREPPNAGRVIIETYLFVGVMCMTFFELVLVAYLSFLEHAITKGEVFLPSLQGGTYSYCTTLQSIVCNRDNSEVVWLRDEWSLNTIKENKNQSDILAKPLFQNKFHRICDRIIGG